MPTVNLTHGTNALTGGTSNDKILGGSGNDILDGGGGSDTVNGFGGDDTLIYNLTANTAPAAKDVYIGGSGKDTLVLQFTQAQWLNTSTQTQVTAYRNHLKTVTSTRTGEVGNGSANDFVFKFGASSLTVQTVERLKVFVDGVEQGTSNPAPTAVADSAFALEDGPGISIDVLKNDIMSGTLKTLSITSPPAHGSATLIKPDINNPSSWYVQYQANAADFQRLASGETATDTFSYTLTNVDGNTSSATATVTITGTNDVVVITSATQAGALQQGAASNIASGTISFNDVDLSDVHAARFAAGANATALGTFALAPVSEAANAAAGSVGWTYTLNNAAARYLAAGQVASETYTVTIDDAHGSTTTQNVLITITGSNDAVSITSAVQAGSVAEDAPSATASGTVGFTDVDLSDTHLATFAAAANATALGTFALGSVSEAANAAGGSVGWNYTLNNAAAQYLAAGQVASETYTVTIDDAHGSTTTQNVGISITGSNDAVSITSAVQAGSMVEDAAATASGAVGFNDVDLSDTHLATFAAAANATALGTFALGPVSEAANAAGGSVGWNYTLDNAAAQYLAAGQVANETYTVTIDDAHGSTATQNVGITITGSNDAVSITSAAQAGTVNAAASTAAGMVSFADADLADLHSATFAAGANATALGTFALAPVNEAANAAAGTVGWTYTLSDTAAQSLSAGQVATETYTIMIDDGHGSSVAQQVVITVGGTNHPVSITSAAQAGAMVEDAPGGVANGTISFADVDLADHHVATFAASANATALGSLALAAVSESDSGGSVGWTYTLNNAAAQHLAAGQVASETYTVTIDDAHGSTVMQDVVITITGTNDGVSITSAAQAGALAEDTGSSSASGTVGFTDVDLTDSHVATFAARANATALGTFALAAVGEAASAGSVGWTYTMNNAAAQYLAAGQVASETYAVTIDDGHGSTVTQDVVITITGTNDTVSITSGAQAGALTEDAASVASGTVSFTDVDLTDRHVATFTAGANTTALGTFALAAVGEAASAGSVGWTYTLNNATAQSLAAGQVASETYSVTIDDGHGSRVTQDVVITITGTNDAASVTSGAQVGALAEDAGSIASGAVTFTDVDLTDSHIATFAAGANATALGTFALAAVSAGDSSRSVGWTYTMNNAATQYLAAGQVASETYSVTINDGHGSTVTQDVVITITGTNDAVSITSSAQAGALAEDAASVASGTVTFSDVDLTDSHVATFTAGANATALGSFALAAVSAGNSSGSVGWTYTLNNTAVQYLSAGQVATEIYTVTIDDVHGSTVTQDVVITITGSNDAVSITSGAQVGMLAEDAASVASGTVTFTDVDLADSHIATFTAGANATALGTFALAAVGAGDSSGSVGWTYTLNNATAQSLAAGQVASEIYSIAIDDGRGSTVTQDVVINITGTNDAVIITSAAQAGVLTEDAASGASGTVTFTDVDLTDSHIATFTAGANATALGTFAVSQTASSGSVGWTYVMNNAAAQYLAAGQVASETYTIRIDDLHGSAVTQDVVITISGTNDNVSITSAAQAGTLVEDAASGIASGTVTFTDIDLTDSHVATFTAGANATALGTFAVSQAASGSVGWTYTMNNASAQSLAVGQVASETYTITIDDSHGSTVTQEVVITITGTNDAVSITSAGQAGALAEDSASSIASGTVTFTDVDLTDSHVATFAAGANATALGTFALATLSEAANAVNGSVGWTYTVNNTASQSLAAGQVASETYSVTIDDGHGSTVRQDVVITITGTNDAVTITSAAQADTLVEDAASSIASGTVTFTDVDLTDSHVATFAAGANATALGTFALATLSEAANAANGSVGWTYTLNNTAVQYLAAGQVTTEIYTVTIDDAHGSTVTQDVVITITGSNDAVSITSGAQAGMLTEDAASSIASGMVTFTDVDLTDSHVATFTAGANATALGTFAVSQAASPGSVGWTYTMNNAAAQYLAAGQVASETYTITIDDLHGSTVTQDVVITITGTNDAVSITSAAQAGTLAEDAASSIASGTVTFTDVDLTDSHVATFAAGANATALGTFALATLSEAANAVNGSVGWTYTVNNTASQSLAAGQVASETYSVTIDDGHGSTVRQDVVITITGTNDAVTITSAAQAGTLVEDAASSIASGTVTFTDVDLTDSHVATFTAGANATALGTFALATPSEAANAANGSVGWTYTVNNAAAQYLAAGQAASETYTITIDDAHGSTVTQDVVITITGSNDAVSITSAAQAGALAEDAASSIASGTVTFTDVDLSDSHIAKFTAGANVTALGTFALATLSEAANAANGSVGWTYTVNNAAAQYLAAGQLASETYTITIDDAHGSTVTQDVVITITGSNDNVSITSAAQAGALAEDAASSIASGTVTFTDVDLSDSHIAKFTPGANATALGTFALATLSEAPNAANGSVGWTYTVNNAAAQYLAAGQAISETYTITIDDAHGSTVTQDVVITITGSNDAVSITSAAQKGTIVEDAASSIASGTVSFTDVDLSDGHAATLQPGANATTLGTFALATLSEAANAASGSVGWSYTLNNAAAQYLAAGQAISEICTVTIDDAHGSTTTQEVVMTITGSNDAVSITSAAQTGALVQDAASNVATGSVSFTDPDLADGHAATFAAGANATALGTFALAGVVEAANAAAGSVGWTYTLNNAAARYLGAGQTASETYTVTIGDGHGSSTSQDIVITTTGINDAPTGAATATLAPGVQNTAYTVSETTLLQGFSDVDSATVLHVANLGANHGTVTANANGTFTITPTTDYSGLVVLSYTVVDGSGGSIAGTGSFSLGAANRAPTGSATAVLAAGREDSAYTLSAASLLTGFSDPDGDALGVTGLSVTNGSVVNNGNGTFTITPAPNYNGVIGLNYSVTDGRGGTVAAQQSISVAAVNDAPAGSDKTVNMVEDKAITFKTSDFGFSDVNDSPANALLALKLTTLPGASAGLVLLNNAVVTAGATISAADIAAGKLTFVPADNYNNGTATAASLTFQVQDDGGSLNGGSNLDATPNTLNFLIAADNSDLGSGSPDTYTLSVNNGNVSILDSSGSKSVDQSTNSSNSFSAFNFERFSDNLEFTGISGTSGSVRLTILNQYFLGGGTTVDKMTFTNGGSVAGYALSTSSYDLFTSLTGSSNNDLIAGSSADETITGNSGNDLLFGGAGNDRLIGGSGRDLLTGGLGADRFVFNSTLSASSNVDTIVDFAAGTDVMELTLSYFAAATATGGVLDASNFRAAAGGSALTSSQRILFDTSTGNLFYDADGSGSGSKVQFAQISLVGLSGTLSNTDFRVV